MKLQIREIAVLFIIVAVSSLFLYMFFSADTNNKQIQPNAADKESVDRSNEVNKVNNTSNSINMDNFSKAIIKTNYGEITLDLYTDVMPITVGNFVTLAKEGFYDGTKFHRVIPGFMIQGGDPNTKSDDISSYGTGGPGYTIEDEFVADERLSNTEGTVAMANTGQPNSGGSQFFINVYDNLGLDYDKEPIASKHPVFAKVVSGMDVVKEIESINTNERDVPTDPVVIESITVE